MGNTYNDDMCEICIARVKELRKKYEYTQNYVAYVLKTSQTMYSRYERSATVLPLRHLYTLAKLFNVSSDYLLGLTDDPTPRYREDKDKRKRRR